jgi:hypothetical protein
MSAIHILLRNSIDYAGLFPPAELDMKSSVENYSRYKTSPISWALGRFVVPVKRLVELETTAEPHLRPAGEPWLLTALLGAEVESDIAAIDEFNQRQRSSAIGNLVVDSVELRANSVVSAETAIRRIPAHLQAYIEIPIDGDPSELIAVIARLGRRAKVRTGGVTSDAFPDARDLIRFMVNCNRRGVAFKATAGLHHPFRAEYRLTYQPDSPSGTMFGFLNLFLAAGFLQSGMDDRQAERVLEERSVDAFQLEDDAVHWRQYSLSLDQLEQSRRQGLVSFGSCSFTEPLEELQALHLLDSRVSPA